MSPIDRYQGAIATWRENTVNIENRFLKLALAAIAILALPIACTQKSEAPTQDAAAKPAEAAAPAAGLITGKALETMDASGYTYVLLDTGTEQRWIAGPSTTVNVGDEIQTDSGMAMKQFHSTSMNRDFEVVYFVAAMRNLTSGVESAAPKSASIPSAPAAAPLDVTVEPLQEGENIEAVFANPDKYAGKEFSVRGTVVKYNSNIMGKNWLHLQDGSGDTGLRNSDLTVTTDSVAAVGDVVVATGNIVLDKDFGAGYQYPILMEDAKLTVEK